MGIQINLICEQKHPATGDWQLIRGFTPFKWGRRALCYLFIDLESENPKIKGLPEDSEYLNEVLYEDEPYGGGPPIKETRRDTWMTPGIYFGHSYLTLTELSSFSEKELWAKLGMQKDTFLSDLEEMKSLALGFSTDDTRIVFCFDN